jgi:Site-specific recombinase XerD
MNTVGVVFESNYFCVWKEYCGLKPRAMEATINVLHIFQDFLNDLQFEGMLDFNRFFYYSESDDYQPIDREFIEEFVTFLVLQNPGLSNKTIYNKLSSLKSFFGFLERMNLIHHNPMANFKNTYYERNININFLSELECKKILRYALKIDPFSKYYFLLIWTAITSALRNRELCYLTFDQIDFTTGMVRVDKGQKTNAKGIALPRLLTKELLNFKQYKETIDGDISGFVFSVNGRRLSGEKLLEIVKTICKKAGITRNVTVHDLRRTTGYLLLAAGVSVRAIQQQYRHCELSTTYGYLSLLDSMFLFDENT